jgi:hypothetical protein
MLQNAVFASVEVLDISAPFRTVKPMFLLVG